VIQGHDSVVVRTMTRLLVPWIRIFALYVLFHGHYSPGGGFQGGVIMASSYILIGLALGRPELEHTIPELSALRWAVGGALLFLLTGIAGLAGGGALFDYGATPLPAVAPITLRYFGILVIEAGVFVAVTAALTLVFIRIARTAETEAR
jgi:multicomponent Na+:H+ antiporter subunit B